MNLKPGLHPRNKHKNDDRKNRHFFVPVNEIIENAYDLSLNRYKEIDYEAKKYDTPEVIVEKIQVLENEILETLKSLEK